MLDYDSLPIDTKKAVQNSLYNIYVVFGGISPAYFSRLQELLVEIVIVSQNEPLDISHPIPEIIKEYFPNEVVEK